MNIRRKLQTKLQNAEVTNLERAVIEDILDLYNDDKETVEYMRSVVTHGGVSGTIGSLIYYADTYKFFDEHYEDIMDMLQEIEDETGELFIDWKGNIKNTGAWLAYEETTRKLLEELQIEY